MHTHGGIAHIAFKLRTRDEGCDRVDHNHVHRAGTYQRFGDFERLFADVRLGNQQVIHVHTHASRIDRIKGMFHIDKGRCPTHTLGLGDDVLAEGGFPGRFRAVDFSNTPSRNAAYA